VPLGAHDAVERLVLPIGYGSVDAEVDELRIAADRVQRGARLMAHHGEKLALRLIGFVGDLSRHLEVVGTGHQLVVDAGQLEREQVRLAEDAPGHRKECLHAATEQLATVIAEHRGERRIDGDDRSAVVEGDHATGQAVEQRA
jgi:hypothetical protein